MAERSWAAELLASPAPERGVELTWLGQSSVVLRAAGVALLVDPFLSPRDDRLVPPPDRPEAFAGVDAVLITHEHYDHLDPVACHDLASASPQTPFTAPRPITDQLTALGIERERIVAMQPGDRTEISGATVTAVPACHGVHAEDAYSLGRELSGGDVRYLGYVIEIGGARLYNAGDTIDFELGSEDAVELAVRAGAGVVVPMHYDMFAANLGDVGRFTAYATEAHPDLALIVPGRLRPLTIV